MIYLVPSKSYNSGNTPENGENPGENLPYTLVVDPNIEPAWTTELNETLGLLPDASQALDIASLIERFNNGEIRIENTLLMKKDREMIDYSFMIALLSAPSENPDLRSFIYTGSQEFEILQNRLLVNRLETTCKYLVAVEGDKFQYYDQRLAKNIAQFIAYGFLSDAGIISLGVINDLNDYPMLLGSAVHRSRPSDFLAYRFPGSRIADFCELLKYEIKTAWLPSDKLTSHFHRNILNNLVPVAIKLLLDSADYLKSLNSKKSKLNSTVFSYFFEDPSLYKDLTKLVNYQVDPAKVVDEIRG